uniref:Phage tail collar domain-containing protein n=1 Tax=viral metagenome TaxID=1070528 RepID=A0A6C0KTL2_9ZZZZ
MTSVLSRSSALTARTKPLTGDTKSSFVNDDHMGWMNCDGRSLDTTAYALLFKVIGYTFGGSGANFNLPNMKGRVMGSVNTVVDPNESTTFAPGQSVGEVRHKLTVPEMPAHNHNKATPSPGVDTTADGTTSVQADHTHGITDPGHSHSYFNQPNSVNPAVSLTTTDVADNVNVNQTTGTSTTGIVINPAGSHSHTISSNGGDQYHNNMQPTLFYGNTFIYCGIPTFGSYPYTTGSNPVLI